MTVREMVRASPAGERAARNTAISSWPYKFSVPPPLSIGTLELSDGRSLKGFLVEAEAIAGARDISSFGGWRAFMAQEKAPA